MKLLNNSAKRANQFFWRLQTGAELDYVEETGSTLKGYEFKWGAKTGKMPAAWPETYPQADFQVVNKDNWLPFVLEV